MPNAMVQILTVLKTPENWYCAHKLWRSYLKKKNKVCTATKHLYFGREKKINKNTSFMEILTF